MISRGGIAQLKKMHDSPSLRVHEKINSQVQRISTLNTGCTVFTDPFRPFILLWIFIVMDFQAPQPCASLAKRKSEDVHPPWLKLETADAKEI